MRKFEYEVSVNANTQEEADRKMKAVMSILPKLTTEELIKVAAVVNDPIKLALVKAQL